MNLLISLLVAAALGQSSTAAQPSVGDLSQSTYQIGAQDELKITVLDEPSLSQSYRVDSDGSITMDYIGRIRAAGSTPADLQERVRTLLARGDFLKNPQVRVEVESYKSQSVIISGEVRSPGKLPMMGAMTLLEALAAAGSPTAAASSEVTIAHIHRTPDGQNAELTRVNWKELQLGRGTDVALQDGDLINVPKAQTFFITGQVQHSGNYVLEPDTTVRQAIALAGGLTDRGSDRRIKATRLVKGKPIEVSLKLEDKIEPGDTVTVEQRFF
jgi:polysaccharide export outer membrane protein